ncbi:MAG TPA: hypothetical protein VEK11_24230 [Thermoanaerobaculia bacterium]|nr:hypothetical protein [Thermoanaerobaculia bacterium]
MRPPLFDFAVDFDLVFFFAQPLQNASPSIISTHIGQCSRSQAAQWAVTACACGASQAAQCASLERSQYGNLSFTNG